MAGHDLQTIEESLAAPFTPPQSNKVIINVGGVRFETYKSTLRNIPDTRLAWITESKADNPDYDPATGEYFFDRHPNMFLMILNYYRTGKLHAPSDVCGPGFEDELNFWGIDEKQIESCCWANYSEHRDAQQTLKELKIDISESGEDEDEECDHPDFGSTAEKFGIVEEFGVKKSFWNKWRPRIWNFLDNPFSSRAAFGMTCLSFILTVCVIISFTVGTHLNYRVALSVSNPAPLNATEKEKRMMTQPHPTLTRIEIVCMSLLTVEFVFRIIFNPDHKVFFKKVLNWIDILSIVPYFGCLLAEFLYPQLLTNEAFLICLDVIRLIRIIKLSKIMMNMEGLKILFHTLSASARELVLVVMLIVLLMTFFASLIYIAERIEEDPNNEFPNIPIACWWAIVTMTTLGYGDMVPKSLPGYLIGIICALCGLLFVTLPIPIIVNNFSNYYAHAKAQSKLPKKRKHALVGAADALKQTLPDETELEEQSHDDSRSPSPPAPPLLRVRTVIPHIDESNEQCSDDSGVNSSSFKSDNTASGISVTFTDTEFDSTSELQIRVPVIIDPEKAANAWKPMSGVVNSPATGRQPAPAVNRRGSILPGGVSNGQHSPAGVGRKASLAVGRSDPRERRRSLMPMTPY